MDFRRGTHICGTAAESIYGDAQADNINTLVNAAGIKMEPYWANLFSKLFANKNIGDLIANVGAGERPGSAEVWDVLMGLARGMPLSKRRAKASAVLKTSATDCDVKALTALQFGTASGTCTPVGCKRSRRPVNKTGCWSRDLLKGITLVKESG